MISDSVAKECKGEFLGFVILSLLRLIFVLLEWGHIYGLKKLCFVSCSRIDIDIVEVFTYWAPIAVIEGFMALIVASVYFSKRYRILFGIMNFSKGIHVILASLTALAVIPTMFIALLLLPGIYVVFYDIVMLFIEIVLIKNIEKKINN